MRRVAHVWWVVDHLVLHLTFEGGEIREQQGKDLGMRSTLKEEI